QGRGRRSGNDADTCIEGQDGACVRRKRHDLGIAFRGSCDAAAAPSPAKWPPSSLASEVLALLPQRLELGLLLGDALRPAFFVRSAGIRRGLLDQLTQVAADDG